MINFGSFFPGKDQFREVSLAKEHSCFLQKELRWKGNIINSTHKTCPFHITDRCANFEVSRDCTVCSLVVCLLLFMLLFLTFHQKRKLLAAIICFSFSLHWVHPQVSFSNMPQNYPIIILLKEGLLSYLST